MTAAKATTLVDAHTLEAELSRWRVLDCRASLADPEAGRRAFAEGHIPDAQHADLERDLSAPAGAGGRHPLPDPDALAERFRAWGIDCDDPVAVYDDSGGAFAARAWWLARWLGHERVAVLDGGLAAWNGPLAAASEVPARGNFRRRTPLTRTADADEVLASLGTATLIDARAEARFSGREEPIDPVAGHIPGAHCRPFQGNLDAQGRFLEPAALLERFEPLARDPVCYCGSGVTAAHNILAMRIAGLPEARLYPGSWSEWIRDPAHPIDPARPRS